MKVFFSLPCSPEKRQSWIGRDPKVINCVGASKDVNVW